MSSTNIMNVLPEDIQKHILSLLPTKDAFTTKFVSKSWVPQPELLNVLRIDSIYKPETWIDFYQFMNVVLLSPCIQHNPLKTLYIFCHYKVRRPCFRINQCVEAAKHRGIEDLDITWYCGVSSPTIFCCKTFVVLRLQAISILSMVGFSIDLPFLKTLFLFGIIFDTLDDLMKLLYGCPKLEDLTTKYVSGKLGITSPRCFEPLSNLIKATTWFSERRQSNYVEFLVLSKMGYSDYKVFRLFENLTELRIFWFYQDTYDWSEIVKMLFNCPKLEALYIEKEVMKHDMTKTTKDDWKYPDHVPECVRSHLTTCNIINYRAVEADFRFAIYILKNARLLQDMTIHVHSSSNTMQRAQFVENLSSFPRTSPACNLLLK